jgi:drug/metabolite transporter (DMT)-like permease
MLVRILVVRVPPFQVAALRFLIAAMLLLTLSRLKRLAPPRTGREWIGICKLGTTMMAIPYLCVFWAEQYITSSMTSVLFSTFPLAVTLMTHLMTEHRVPRQAVIAMAIGFGGIAWLYHAELSATHLTAIGGVLVLLSVISGAWATVYAQREHIDLNPISSTAWQFAVAFVATATMSGIFESQRTFEWTWPLFGVLVVLAVLGSALAFVLYYWMLARLPAYQLGTLDLITPFIAILEGAWFLSEPIPAGMVVVALMIAVMVASLFRTDRSAVEQAIHDAGSLP